MSTAAREAILARVRGGAEVEVPREYRRSDPRGREELLDLFCDRLTDLGAQVRRVAPSEVSHAAGSLELRRLASPVACPSAWLPEGVEVVRDDDGRLSAEELDGVDGALTGCAVAIAETGTIVLDGRGVSGRRVLSLVPDHHICVVGAEQVVGSVPEGLAAVREAAVDGAPITLVSGPSATSDIELVRVPGVHGPRRLLVLLVSG